MRVQLLALVLLSATAPAKAQTVSVKWALLNRPVYLHTAMPSGCDTEVGRAVTAWNSAGSKFTYQFDRAANLTTTRGTASSVAYPVIEDGATSSTTALMTTNRYTTGSTITEADIIVKAEYLWFNNDQSGGKFHCSPTAAAAPATKYDFQTAITHELGHALGVDHGGATSCIMYASLGLGTMRRSACSTEAAALKSAYGTR